MTNPIKNLLLTILLQNSLSQTTAQSNPQSLAVFSNLQCKRGWMCIDLDTTEAQKYTDNLKRDLSFGTCSYESVNIQTIQIEENVTRACFNIDEGNCGVTPYTDEQSEEEKY